MRSILLVIVFLLSACSINPALIRELGKDHATACIRVSSIYGVVEFARSNIMVGEVRCNGLEIKTPGETVVPVRVVPVQP